VAQRCGAIGGGVSPATGADRTRGHRVDPDGVACVIPGELSHPLLQRGPARSKGIVPEHIGGDRRDKGDPPAAAAIEHLVNGKVGQCQRFLDDTGCTGRLRRRSGWARVDYERVDRCARRLQESRQAVLAPGSIRQPGDFSGRCLQVAGEEIDCDVVGVGEYDIGTGRGQYPDDSRPGPGSSSGHEDSLVLEGAGDSPDPIVSPPKQRHGESIRSLSFHLSLRDDMLSTMTKRYFTPQLFGFLSDLAANNDREWFKANRDAYDRYVQEPALEFINDFAAPLARISQHFVADSRTVGGSLFRIQRDTRFSRDKSPYKANTGLQFRHIQGRDAHAPGFYLHLEPGECFMGVGLWHPETSVAYAIRDAIAEDPGRWKRVTRAKRFSDVFALGGEQLKRPPKGFDPDHPLLEDLKRKDFIASVPLTQKEVVSDHFLDDFAANCKRAAPFMGFLCDAVGVPF